MARRDVHHLAFVEARVDYETMLVDRLVHDPCSRAHQQLAHRRTAGVLERHGRGAIDEQLHQQVERVLPADRYQDLVRAGADASPRQHLRPDFLDQHRVVGETFVAPDVAGWPAGKRHATGLAPLGHGIQRRVELSVDERVWIATPVRRTAETLAPARRWLESSAPARDLRLARRCGAFESDATLGRLLVDVDPAAWPAHEQAFIHQLADGEYHGVARDVQLLGELARRRQPAPAGIGAVGYRVHQALAKLALQADLALRIEVDQRLLHARDVRQESPNGT